MTSITLVEQILATDNNEDLFRAMAALHDWLRVGNEPPSIPGEQYISISNGGIISYSIIYDPTTKGHEFIYYENDCRVNQYDLR